MVSNCSVRRVRRSSEIEIVIASKMTEVTHANRLSPKRVSIIIFMRRSLWSRQTLRGNVVELAEGYPKMKTISKSLTLLRAKKRAKIGK